MKQILHTPTRQSHSIPTEWLNDRIAFHSISPRLARPIERESPDFFFSYNGLCHSIKVMNFGGFTVWFSCASNLRKDAATLQSGGLTSCCPHARLDLTLKVNEYYARYIKNHSKQRRIKLCRCSCRAPDNSTSPLFSRSFILCQWITVRTLRGNIQHAPVLNGDVSKFHELCHPGVTCRHAIY